MYNLPFDVRLGHARALHSQKYKVLTSQQHTLQSQAAQRLAGARFERCDTHIDFYPRNQSTCPIENRAPPVNPQAKLCKQG